MAPPDMCRVRRSYCRSCRPNCDFELGAGGALVVRTLRPVREREELSIGYCNCFTANRREYLRKAYFFDCACPRCAQGQRRSAVQPLKHDFQYTCYSALVIITSERRPAHRCVPREQACPEVPPLMKRMVAASAAGNVSDAVATAERVVKLVRPLLARGARRSAHIIRTPSSQIAWRSSAAYSRCQGCVLFEAAGPTSCFHSLAFRQANTGLGRLWIEPTLSSQVPRVCPRKERQTTQRREQRLAAARRNVKRAGAAAAQQQTLAVVRREGSDAGGRRRPLGSTRHQ